MLNVCTYLRSQAAKDIFIDNMKICGRHLRSVISSATDPRRARESFMDIQRDVDDAVKGFNWGGLRGTSVILNIAGDPTAGARSLLLLTDAKHDFLNIDHLFRL
jgi:hypothetical protein